MLKTGQGNTLEGRKGLVVFSIGSLFYKDDKSEFTPEKLSLIEGLQNDGYGAVMMYRDPWQGMARTITMRTNADGMIQDPHDYHPCDNHTRYSHVAHKFGLNAQQTLFVLDGTIPTETLTAHGIHTCPATMLRHQPVENERTLRHVSDAITRFKGRIEVPLPSTPSDLRSFSQAHLARMHAHR